MYVIINITDKKLRSLFVCCKTHVIMAFTRSGGDKTLEIKPGHNIVSQSATPARPARGGLELFSCISH